MQNFVYQIFTLQKNTLITLYSTIKIEYFLHLIFVILCDLSTEFILRMFNIISNSKFYRLIIYLLCVSRAASFQYIFGLRGQNNNIQGGPKKSL